MPVYNQLKSTTYLISLHLTLVWFTSPTSLSCFALTSVVKFSLVEHSLETYTYNLNLCRNTYNYNPDKPCFKPSWFSDYWCHVVLYLNCLFSAPIGEKWAVVECRMFIGCSPSSGLSFLSVSTRTGFIGWWNSGFLLAVQCSHVGSRTFIGCSPSFLFFLSTTI